MRFSATLELGGKTATGIKIPAGVVESLGTSKKPPVTVTINGYTYRTTVFVREGGFIIAVSAENRAGAGIEAGDQVDVDIALDDKPRTVEVPEDFAAALAAAGARGAFDALSFSQQRAHVDPINAAKTDETRQRRISKSAAALSGA